MLSSLDTLIAFTVIITIASVLVTLLVQMVSFLLSLRGKNLANALALAFHKIAPELDDQAHELANRILSGQLLSDSTVTTKKAGKARHVERSKPWHWLALSPSAGKLANAIRPEEVWTALTQISQGSESLASSACKLLNAAGAGSPPAELIAKLIHHDETPALGQPFQELLDKLSAGVSSTLESAKTKFLQSFNAAQDRASQWFQTHARWVAILASITVAIGLQLDTIEIFSYCSTSDSARAALVKASEGALKHAGEILSEDKAGEEKAADDKFKKYMESKEKQLADLQRISGAAFEIFPKDGFRWEVETESSTDSAGQKTQAKEKKFWASFKGHILGVLLTIGLLTLGAPFWYDMLKNLTGLKPALARLMGQEKEAREKRSTQPNP